MMTLPGFLLALFSSLEKQGVKYCVLRNYEELPEQNIGTDIDVLIKEEDLVSALHILTQIEGVRLTDVIQRPYVVSIFMDGLKLPDGKDSLQLDYFTSLSWKGLPFLKVDAVLAHSVPHITHPVIRKPAPHHEALISLFSSYLVGGWIKEKYQANVQKYFSQHEALVINALAIWAGRKFSTKFVKAVLVDNRSALMDMLPEIKVRLVVHYLYRQPIFALREILRYYAYELAIRFTSRPISQICILGMDGAGKSTVIKLILEQLGNRTKGYEVIHLKPRRRGNYNAVSICSDPHALPPRSNVLSALKLFSWVAMYHVRRIFHGHTNSTLIIWDRYIYDVLVDPVRYRVALPRWLLWHITKLAPVPLVVIFLDVPAEVAFARKQEVALEDMHLLRKGYLELAAKMPKAKVISTAGDVEGTVNKLVETVSVAMAQQTSQRIANWRTRK